MKRYDAKDLANKRAEIFDAAASETVVINNNNYRNLVFELTSRKRGQPTENKLQELTENK